MPFVAFVFGVSLWLTIIAGYLTHIVWAVKLLATATAPTVGQIVLSVAGTFIPPIGVLHGMLMWFGVV